MSETIQNAGKYHTAVFASGDERGCVSWARLRLRPGQMQEHIVQRRSMSFEVTEDESSFDAGLEKISGLAVWREDDLPVASSRLPLGEGCSARATPGRRGRIGLGAQADAARQQRPGLFLIAIENFPRRGPA